MRSIWKTSSIIHLALIWIVIGFAIAALCIAATPPSIIIRGGTQWGISILTELARDFPEAKTKAAPTLDINRWDGMQNVEKFAAGKCDILAHRSFPNIQEAALLSKTFVAGKAQPKQYLVAQGKVAVIVHIDNPIKIMTLAQVDQLLGFSGKDECWTDLRGSNTSAVRCYGEGVDSASRIIMRHACMMLGPEHPTGYHLYRKDFTACADGDEVIMKVQHDINGIGFIQYQGQPLVSVKLLAIGATEQGPFIALKLGRFMQQDYPLAEPLMLYLRPNAPDLAREFCEFAVSEKGSEILGQGGFITPRANAKAEADERVAQMKQGKGDPIKATGSIHGTFLMNDLAFEYTKTKAAVQLKYTARLEREAVGEFLNGQDVLVSNGPVKGEELPYLLKGKWEALMGSSTGILPVKKSPTGGTVMTPSPTGKMPVLPDHCIAVRAVAIVVHGMSKLDALTTDQVRAIFTGKVSDWKVLAAVAGDVKHSDIHCYGVDRPDPAFELFYQKLDLRDLGRLERKHSAAEVLEALAMDSQGIAFVNLADLPSDPAKFKQLGVKVLAIGEGNQAVHPDIGAIMDGRYSLAERLYLYGNPHASAAAKAFVAYITSPDVGAEVFVKDGFMPTAGR